MTEQEKRKKSLLDEDDGYVAAPESFGIRVNKEYAARFEHNKRREELHRLQSKYPEEAEKLARKIAREAAKAAGEALPGDNEDQDSSDYEEEDDGDVPEEVEAKIFDTLLRIRKQDPSIYQKDVQFFEEEEEEEEGPASGKPARAKKKPMYLKDMIAKQAVEYGPGGDSNDEEYGAKGVKDGKKQHPKAYDQEQEALRSAFLKAAVEAEEDLGAEDVGGVLRLRPEAQGASADGEEVADGTTEQVGVPEQKLPPKGTKKGAKSAGQFQQLIEAYFGSEAELNSDDKFLKEYIMNKGWVDRDDDYVPSYREIVGDDGEDGEGGAEDEGVDDDEDEKYLRQVDAYEAKYNFRYEEPGADRIITHPRNIDGTVRKADDKRKRQRDAKKQRVEEATEAARDEVKRLKNLKKQEIESKLDRLRSVAGAAAPAATSLDDMLEGDFDPEEWDKKMAAAFNDDYYAVDEDLGDLKDDMDLHGEDLDDSADDDGGSGDGTVRFRTLQRKIKELDELGEGPEDEESGEAPIPEMVAKQRAELQRLLEEYYKLDYEDVVGGIKTRFRYKEVPAITFGLSVDEILRLDDKTLNQVVGIKRLAPYRDGLNKPRPNYKALEMVKGDMANLKNQRRPYKKREWQKGSGGGRQGGQWWHGKGDGGGGGDAAAAGVGPGRSNAGGTAGREPHSAQQVAGKGAAEDNEKEKASLAGRDEKAGPGPNSAAMTEADGRSKKRKRLDGQLGGGRCDADPPARRFNAKAEPQLDPKQARLASYAVPTLKKEWAAKAGKGKKRKDRGQVQDTQGGPAEAPTDGLSRAQRKNLKRAQKRATKRAADGGAGAQ